MPRDGLAAAELMGPPSHVDSRTTATAGNNESHVAGFLTTGLVQGDMGEVDVVEGCEGGKSAPPLASI